MQYESIETNTPAKILLKGESGTGKTFKALQFPRPVIINFENNLRCLNKLEEAQRKQVKVLNPKKDVEGKTVRDVDVFENTLKLISEASAEPAIDTIIIDSFTALSDYILIKIVGTNSLTKKLEIQHWGDYTRYVNYFGRLILNNSQMGKHIICIVHEQTLLTKDGVIDKYILSLPTRIKDTFQQFFADVWRTYAIAPITDKGKVKYMVRGAPSKVSSGKSTFNAPDSFEWDMEKDKILSQLSATS